MPSHPDSLCHQVSCGTATVDEPQQLTLWPDSASGQMPLFNRKAQVGRLSEAMAQYCEHCESVLVRHSPGRLCFHCEDLLAEYLASRKPVAKNPSPAAEPIWEPDEWFGKRPPMDTVPAALSCL